MGSSVIELVWDKPKLRYVARTLQGGLAGMEIWTKLEILEQYKTGVDVSFHVPEMPEESAAKVGKLLVETYTTLWREDEEMMIWRENALANSDNSSSDIRVDLGSPEALRRKLPFLVNQNGVSIWIDQCDGELVAFSAQCPHMLGPLAGAEMCGGRVHCPWHGYKFNVQTGESIDQHGLNLVLFDVVTDPNSGNMYVETRSA